ncbi:NUDIX hydrolase [Allokutzneria albata]|uniref:ADP-ribose pyrophosphatase YjhB, NUDIX family n=1 Tax=Allokutzneria albata TaxID=211114 RepID=A0A1G9S352_ALLAB|nr:NUDIX domain-containing protein [Allokutzneria albata]SDM29929.1 ADP-ribose pyrophosphatase YjhB, NUDIX family [Allokutzneria albata]
MTLIDKIGWIRLEEGRILCARSYGKDLFYVPGGKRDAGETDLQALVREIAEELAVAIAPETARHVGTFEAQADGKSDGVVVRVTCYTAEHTGIPAPTSEIEEIRWLGYADRDRMSTAGQLIFDALHERGELR